jgi:hypothetical protein
VLQKAKVLSDGNFRLFLSYLPYLNEAPFIPSADRNYTTNWISNFWLSSMDNCFDFFCISSFNRGHNRHHFNKRLDILFFA